MDSMAMVVIFVKSSIFTAEGSGTGSVANP